MSVNECAPCSDVCLKQNASYNELSFRQFLIQVACLILEDVDNIAGGGTPAVILPQKGFTAAQVTAGFAVFANTTLLDSTKKLRKVRIVNSTDADLEFSVDGGASVAFRVGAGNVYENEIGNLTMAATTSFQMRIASGSSATLGNVYLEGQY